jgi:hypothetical protein
MDWKTQQGYVNQSFSDALACKKCLLSSFLGLLALNYAGLTNGVSTNDPATLIKPYAILFGASVVTDFLMMEYNGSRSASVAPKK